MKKISTSFVLLLFIIVFQTDNKDRQSTKTHTVETVEQPKTEEDGYLFEGCFQLEETNGENTTITFIILEIKGTNVSEEEAIEMNGPEHQAVAAGSF